MGTSTLLQQSVKASGKQASSPREHVLTCSLGEDACLDGCLGEDASKMHHAMETMISSTQV